MKRFSASISQSIERSTSFVGKCLTAALLASASATVLSQPTQCGSIANAYGPYDYRTDRDKLPIVDGAHFPPIVEALIRGNRGALGGDLDYTLRAFPNHHRALIAVMRYGQKVKSPQPRDLPRPVECYFERALRFRPDDSIVHMIYAQYLSAHARKGDADRQLRHAAQHAGDSGFTHNNIGLVYFDMKNYPMALAHAHKAIQLGFSPTALQGQLASVGQWSEPAAGVHAPAVPASAPRQ